MANFNAGYNQVINETMKVFNDSGISAVGEGFRDVASRKDLFEQYVQCMSLGITDADDAKNVEALIENANKDMLTESSISGIAPISSLNGPVIRKLWPKFSLRQAVTTSVINGPVVTISWTRPFMEVPDANGKPVRTYLPRGLRSGDADGSFIDMDDLTGKNVVTRTVAGASGVADFWNGADVVQSSASLIKYQPIDPVVTLASITLGDGSTAYFADASIGAATIGKSFTISVEKNTGIDNNLYYTFSKTLYTGNTASVAGTAVTFAGTILVQAAVEAFQEKSQIKDGKIMVAFIAGAGHTGGATGVVANAVIRARYSSEFNEVTPSVSMDVTRKDIRVGSGDHVNASFPVEQLHDMSSLYSLDSVALITDTITKIFALKVDQKIYKLIKMSFMNQPGSIDEFESYPDIQRRVLAFDVKPAVGYAGGPKAWREELKPLIDHLASRIKTDTYLDDGIFTLVGNPLDMDIINNVEWQFTSGQSMDGVGVDYAIGVYKGIYTYKAIASPIVPPGFIYIVFLPATNDQRTLEYYAYTYSIEAGYRDPNHANVPSVMVTKRDAVHEFMPAIAAVKILNNGADLSYDVYRDVLPVTSTVVTTNGETSGTGV